MSDTRLRLRSLTVDYPAPNAIKAARKEARCTASEAAASVYVFTQYWKDCEAGTKKMHPAIAELFARKFKIGIYKE